MPYTFDGRHVMLDALAAVGTHLGLLDAGASTALTTPFGANSTDTFTATGHTLSNGDLFVFTSITGASNIVVGRPYYAVGVSGSTFQAALTSGGSAVDLGSDATAGAFTELVEISGGSPAYARKANSWNAAAAGNADNSTSNVTFDVPAGASVDYVSLHSASTAGTLYAIDPVTSTGNYAAQGQYIVTDADLDLLAAGGA